MAARIPASSRQGLKFESCEMYGVGAVSPNMVFGFFDGGEASWGSSGSERSGEGDEGMTHLSFEEEEEEERENGDGGEENRAFWERQHQVLQGTLCRTSTLETKIRSATKEAVKGLKMNGEVCVCNRPTTAGSGGCRKCLIREVCGRLQDAGFNCAICKTKWRSSPEIPSGEHTFLDVVDNSNPKRGEVRVVIELSFRAEFEMAKAGDEYNGLIARLPEVFVGKVERLQGLIKVLCSAAKKCMKQRKLHMGPWRKHRYVQAKWLSTTCQRTTSTVMHASSSSSPSSSPSSADHYQKKPKRSMLTMDLLDRLPNLLTTAVEVS